MEPIRVFVSIPIPDRSPLEEVSASLGRLRNVRASPLDQVHITLRFVGDIDPSRTDDVAASVRDAVSGIDPFTVTVSDVGSFPDARKPSVVWIGASPGDVMGAIAGRIGDNLDAHGIDYDRKRFKPHITIGRCRGPADISGFMSEYSGRRFLEFECDRVCVMRSVLGPSGARHSVLREIRL